MTTQALVRVVKGNEVIATFYCDDSGYPEYTGIIIKSSLEKCIKSNDQIFNSVLRDAYFKEVGQDKIPTSFEDFQQLKIPVRDIPLSGGGVANKCVVNEHALAARVCAGLFNENNSNSSPNSVQFYYGKHPEEIPYHYTISLRAYGNAKPPSVDKRPYIIVTHGIDEVLYSGWIDNWTIESTSDRTDSHFIF